MENEGHKRNIFQPVIYAGLIIGGILLGRYVSAPFNFGQQNDSNGKGQLNKISNVLNFIQQEYVDTVNEKTLVNSSIEQILEQLDPHSAYIPAEDLQATNEPLQGNFDGIGIEFHLQDDSVMVVSVIPGGPSSMVGLQPGDRIVKVEQKNFTGAKITNKEVMSNLRGEGGSKVNISVYRRGNGKLLDFTITRGKIPITSIDASYMVDSKTGYIRLSRFGATTFEEYIKAFTDLKHEGMTQLILDLRGNPGGYMETAVKLADEFLPYQKMIVYTEGRSRPRQDYKATADGSFEQGKLVIMIDEGSASASEIVAGALQDWDRATIVGRRSFGKGLVQEQVEMQDGSALRLTVARYYTPTGRSIQKPYANGYDEYQNDLLERYKHGEFESADSIKFKDSLKYKTPGGHIVYGGGGIMPDIFIPLDTTDRTTYYEHALGSGLLIQFAYDYVDANRKSLEQYSTVEEFIQNFNDDKKLLSEVVAYTSKQNIKPTGSELDKCSKLILTNIKAYIARQLYRDNGFYKVYFQNDRTFKKAVEIIHGKIVAEK